MDALVLCGGKGTRLQSVVSDRPKILADIDGQPFLYYHLKYLQDNGIKRVTLCTGYKHEQIREWIYEEYEGPLDVEISKEEEPLGTAGAIKNANNSQMDPYMFGMNGDTFFDVSFNDVRDFFFEKDAMFCVVLSQQDDSSSSGNVVLGPDDTIMEFKEKSNDNETWLSTGLYFYNRAVFDEIPDGYQSLEYDLMPYLVEKYPGRIFGYRSDREFLDFGVPEKYRFAKLSATYNKESQ